MNSARRIFVTAGAAAFALTPVAAGWGAENKAEPAKVDGMTCLDYGRSFICNTASFNAVRFWVESRTVLVDGEQRIEFLPVRLVQEREHVRQREPVCRGEL